MTRRAPRSDAVTAGAHVTAGAVGASGSSAATVTRANRHAAPPTSTDARHGPAAPPTIRRATVAPIAPRDSSIVAPGSSIVTPAWTPSASPARHGPAITPPRATAPCCTSGPAPPATPVQPSEA